MEEDNSNSEVEIPNVTSKTVAMVIDYCKMHVETPGREDLNSWDAELVKADPTTLQELVMATNYLKINRLLDLTGKHPEEIHRMFNIKNDFTPEQEEEAHKENAWAFDCKSKLKTFSQPKNDCMLQIEAEDLLFSTGLTQLFPFSAIFSLPRSQDPSQIVETKQGRHLMAMCLRSQAVTVDM
ncbi:hypothetical protein RJ639_032112 [Escallonia herrerae]|uniref:S-phase kinase-associated protein 1 n=1 Tax=Escallonia herrerae TaxID=1293975 RepID=A0AA88X1M1_9ASTE|nr:hypothetical protein RJ639_032112 [Escallonia herrerae]